MGKLSVIIYITVAIVLLIVISRSGDKNKPHGQRHRGRRLKIRSSFTFTPQRNPYHHYEHAASFDPLVADIERRREDRKWERHYFQNHQPGDSQPEWEGFMDGEDYLNDEERFNVTSRLEILFPKIDVDPADGYVTAAELTQWNLQQSMRELMHRTEREMEIHDRNKDGFVSFDEYQAPSWVTNADNDSFGYNMGWWKEEHFNASDSDGDGHLNVTEFNDFLHPADTNNPKLLLWLCKEEVRERDGDKDGKLNFKEFFDGLFDTIRDYDEGEEHNNSDESDEILEAPAKTLFAQLDKDGDGYLSDVELLPIIGKIHPSEHYFASQQAEYIIQQADADDDDRLTLTEMIESPYVFYNSVLNEEGEEGDYGLHDEFR